MPEEVKLDFSVCCFTEVPLTELHLLTRQIQGRDIELSDYGFVFSREFLVAQGAQPAIYINSYGGDTSTREAADRIELAKRQEFRKGKLRRLLPYLNAMHERYDFTWEREWRVVGDMEFAPEDIVCVTLPEDGEEELKREFLEDGVPIISPGWSTERIVSEFSDQARRAQRLREPKKRRDAKPQDGETVSGERSPESARRSTLPGRGEAPRPGQRLGWLRATSASCGRNGTRAPQLRRSAKRAARGRRRTPGCRRRGAGCATPPRHPLRPAAPRRTPPFSWQRASRLRPSQRTD